MEIRSMGIVLLMAIMGMNGWIMKNIIDLREHGAS